MGVVKVTINGRELEAPAGTTVLEAARDAGIYIPALCHHPDLPPADRVRSVEAVYQGDRRIDNTQAGEPGKGCGLCAVEVQGETDLVRSCATAVREGMVVVTENDRIIAERQANLVPVLTRHPHACLTCAQQDGCGLSQCSSNVPENERCCPRFGHCELQDIARYVGIPLSTPKWSPMGLPVMEGDPLFVRDDNLCIGCTRCVRACSRLRGVEALGFVYEENGQVRVGTLGPTLEDSGCRFCTACVEVCPTGALHDKFFRPGKKEEALVPCRAACPVHVDIPGYLRLVARGRPDEAHAVIREKIPLPGILGRVCTRPCEEVCRRRDVNEAVAICALKRHAADHETGLWKSRSAIKADTGKRAAVVGAGPAGLTAAFYLRKQGHAVTIFEAREKAGGMMRYGIPPFRLPDEVLDRDIREIMDLGMDFKPGYRLGKDFTLGQLKNDAFDAVFLALGAEVNRRVPLLEGSDMPDVFRGVDVLARIAAGKDIRLKDDVIVVGGGDTAMDLALTALRCGAGRVIVVCLEKREEMPAGEWGIRRAEEEGVRILPSRGVLRIVGRDGTVTGVETAGCLSVSDDQGRFAPCFDSTLDQIEGRQVILATGQAVDQSFLGDDSGISVKDGFVVVDQETLETGLEGVFAGGDIVSMPGSVVHAVAAGRKAASAMDRKLGGDGDIDERLFDPGKPEPKIGRQEGCASRPREAVPELGPEAWPKDFAEIIRGFTEEQARREAVRCLQCDLRLSMKANPSPPKKRRAFNEESVREVSAAEGVYKLFDEAHHALAIKGTADLRESLLDELRGGSRAVWFEAEECRMYTQRETELLQQYLREHGEMPGSGDSDLDHLF